VVCEARTWAIRPRDSADDLVVEERNGTLFDLCRRSASRGSGVGVDIDYETVGSNMLMVSASGTAVKLGLHNAVRHRAPQDSM